MRAARSVEQEYYLCAATGRVWSFAEPVLKGMGLVDPCIISSGTQICNPMTGEILWQSNVEPAAVEAALQISRGYNGTKVLINDFTEDDYLHGGVEPRLLSITEPVYFFELIFVPQNIAPEIVAELSKIQGVAVTLVIAQREGYNDVHVTNSNATKEHAVAELLKIIGVNRQDTIGVGDGNNDIHLFNAVGHKVAMGNAIAELKAAADEVIGSVKEDGFTVFLERLAAKQRV